MVDLRNKRFRLFILGAGFSAQAGVPLGAELFCEMRSRARSLFGSDNMLEDEVRDYIRYRELADGLIIDANNVDFEDLMSFLDIEHYLKLRGSDTWSRHGNEGQEIVKRLIAQIIHEATPSKNSIPELYLRFAESLDESDVVITFNYDILLERALDDIGKPYRLVQQYYTAISEFYGEIEDGDDEVTILKMHGSVDWFDIKPYQESLRYHKERGSEVKPPDPVFEDTSLFLPSPITHGPRYPWDELQHIHRIARCNEFYSDMAYPPATPWMISPSQSKFVYARGLEELWYGVGQAGGWNLGFCIVGFSLPYHDEYLRRIIYQMVRNYQESWWDDDFAGTKKAKLKIIDLRTTESEKVTLANRYRFVDNSKAIWYFDGFGENAVARLFADDH